MTILGKGRGERKEKKQGGEGGRGKFMKSEEVALNGRERIDL